MELLLKLGTAVRSRSYDLGCAQLGVAIYGVDNETSLSDIFFPNDGAFRFRRADKRSPAVDSYATSRPPYYCCSALRSTSTYISAPHKTFDQVSQLLELFEKKIDFTEERQQARSGPACLGSFCLDENTWTTRRAGAQTSLVHYDSYEQRGYAYDIIVEIQHVHTNRCIRRTNIFIFDPPNLVLLLCLLVLCSVSLFLCA